jgi:hypothetical protein
VRRRGSNAASSEAETRPSGRQALERGGGSAARRPVLERDGDSPEEYRSRPFGGPLRLLGLRAPSLFQAAATRSAFCDSRVC